MVLYSGVNKEEFKKGVIGTTLQFSEDKLTYTPDQLIRFHVLANSDSDQDQALKRAVRDAILEQVSPKLAAAQSLDESRQILKGVRTEIEDIGRNVVRAWGKDYTVRTEYGHFSFPTKSYGSLVLSAGDYEALRVVIGKGKGSNWWCVLFPPLCFIDIEHSTAVQVDGKPGIPLKSPVAVSPVKQMAEETDKNTGTNEKIKFDNSKHGPSEDTIHVRFYFWELVSKLLKSS